MPHTRPQASGSQVRTRPNGFAIFWALPNPEPDFGSGSAHTPNLGLDLGQVLQGSGPNLGSEPDCGITKTEGHALRVTDLE